MGINASWANSREGEEDAVWCGPVMLPRSIVTENETDTTGVWRTEDESESIKFEISNDLSHAVVTLNVPGKVTGTITLKSKSLDIPKSEEETKTFIFNWLGPIVVADIDADLRFFPQEKGTIERGLGAYEGTGRELKLRSSEGAFGAFDRAWAVALPHKSLTDNWFVWGKAGDYMISIIWMIGRPKSDGILHGSARLCSCNGEILCQTVRAVSDLRGAGEAFSLEYLEGEGLTGSFPPHNVGNRIVFQKGEKRWAFEIRHERLWYEMPFGPPRPGRTGLSGFIASVSGGLVGSEEKFQGSGMVGGGIMP